MNTESPTVETILMAIYGGDAEAARILQEKKVIKGRSAVWNWKAWGHFPARILPQLMEDAKASGVDLALSDIPIVDRKRDVSAA